MYWNLLIELQQYNVIVGFQLFKLTTDFNKMLSYRRETALQGAL